MCEFEEQMKNANLREEYEKVLAEKNAQKLIIIKYEESQSKILLENTDLILDNEKLRKELSIEIQERENLKNVNKKQYDLIKELNQKIIGKNEEINALIGAGTVHEEGVELYKKDVEDYKGEIESLKEHNTILKDCDYSQTKKIRELQKWAKIKNKDNARLEKLYTLGWEIEAKKNKLLIKLDKQKHKNRKLKKFKKLLKQLKIN